jgi:hypothetical protein
MSASPAPGVRSILSRASPSTISRPSVSVAQPFATSAKLPGGVSLNVTSSPSTTPAVWKPRL